MFLQSRKLKLTFFNFFSRRYIGRKIVHYYDEKKTKQPTSIALKYFDLNYSKIFGNQWRSIRLGLVSPNKHVAVLNPFINLEETINEMKLQKSIELNLYYEKYVNIIKKKRIKDKIYLNDKTLNEEKFHENNLDSEEITDTNSELNKFDSDLTSLTASDAKFLFSSSENDEERFINQASSNLSLNTFVPTSEIISNEDIDFNDKKIILDDNFKIDFIEEPYLDFPPEMQVYINKKGVLNYHKAEEDNEDNEDSDDEENSKDDLDYYGDVVKNKKSKYSKYNKMIFSFKQPKLYNKALNYFVMDSASILPVLCLNIKHGDIVADYCSAPGGKALSIIFTKRPLKLMLNDNSTSRLFRLNTVLKSYLSNNRTLNTNIDIRQLDARNIIEEDTYDKILLDVPCLNDRLSVFSNENNIFKQSRLKERTKLPEIQSDILLAGLKSLKLDGNIVYSTCTMHPSQNDYVVQLALQTIEQITDKKFIICNLKECFRPLRGLYKMKFTQFGVLILPYILNNGGPMYICKIKRIQ